MIKKTTLGVYFVTGVLVFSFFSAAAISYMNAGDRDLPTLGSEQLSPLESFYDGEGLDAHVERDKIVIQGNDDFTSENGVVRGTGTEEDPYVIEGWEIDGEEEESEALIVIEDTDAHLVIQDCHLHNTRREVGGESGMGILTHNVKHMTVRRTTINSTFDGIQMFDSYESHIYDNDLSDNRAHGVTLDSSEDIIIEYNRIANNEDDGVLFGTFGGEQANDNIVRHNYIANNTNYGICLFEGEGNWFHHNVFEDVGMSVAVDASQANNFWNTTEGGNWIEGHTEPDEDGDGIVDEPFPIRNVMGDIVDYDHKPLVEQPDTEYSEESPRIEITSPPEEKVLLADDVEPITWNTVPGDGDLTGIDLEFSSDGGSSWSQIGENIEDTGSYDWTVPDISTTEAVIRATVRDDNDRSATDETDLFTITEGRTLRIDIEGEGTTDPESGEYTYKPDEEVTVEAIPKEGWYFEEWIGADETQEQITITLNEDRDMTAVFEEKEDIETYRLNVTVRGAGDVEIDPEQEGFEEDAEVTLRAEADEGWYFEEWLGADETQEQITITLNEDRDITAVFEEKEDIETYRLNVTVHGEGTIIINDEEVEDGWTGRFDEGEDVTLEPVPEEDHEFTEWRGEVTGTEKDMTITMDEDKEMSVVFEEEEEDTPGFTSILLVIASIIAVGIYYKKER